MRTIKALHIVRDGQPLTSIQSGLPNQNEWLTTAELLSIARQIHERAIDGQRISAEPPRHPATPSFLEYPSFEESANFDPVPAVQGEPESSGLYAVYLRDNWDGEGDTYWILARKKDNGVWVSEDSGKELIEHEGDALLKVVPLVAAPQPAEQQPAPGAITAGMLEAIWRDGFDAENYDDQAYCQPLIIARNAVEEAQPAPDVAGLAEALGYLMEMYPASRHLQDTCSAALAAHRKGGDV